MERLTRRALAFCLVVGISAAGLVQGAVAQGRTVTIVFSTNVTTLDPHKTATVSTDLSLISQLYSALVLRGPDLKIKGDLATSWKAIGDNTWRFQLTPGVTFPNGEKLDAEAVKWNFERVLDPKVGARIKSWFAAVKEVKAISPTEVEIVTSKPFPALVDQLSMFFLLPPQWAQQNNPAVAAMGTGPYELKEFRSGERATLTARKDYFGPKPAFDTVTYRVILEEAGRIAALLAGEVDLIDAIPPSEIKRLNDSGRVTAGALPGIRSMYIKFNNFKAPFKDNPKLRQAFNFAVDRQGIVDSLWSGLGKISSCQVLSEAYFGFNPKLKPYAYDPARAKQLLAEAGYPNGLDVEFEVPVARYLQASEIAQITAAQLGEIGVRVKIVELEFGRFMDKYVNGQNMAQMGYIGMSWPTLDADGLLSLLEPGNPYSYYENQDFKKLLQEARTTTDAPKRAEIYQRATDLMCTDAPQIFMFSQPATYAYSKKIEWQKRSDDWMRATDIVAR